jgi:hypothetical protein
LAAIDQGNPNVLAILACPVRFERATYALEEIVSFLIQFINKRSLAECVNYLEIKGLTGLPMAIKIY